MKKMMMTAVAAFAMVMSEAAGVCKIGATEYDSLDAAVEAARPGDMIYLTGDINVPSIIDWTQKNFAGINLDGHKLTVGGYFWNGTDNKVNDSPHLTEYGKKFIISDGSTLTITGQFALNSVGGVVNEVEVHDSGKIVCNSLNYSFKWYNVKLSFFGAADEARVIGTGTQARFYGGGTLMDFIFDEEAFESAKTVAPIELRNVEGGETGKDVGAFVNGTANILGAGRASIYEDTEITIIKSTTGSLNNFSLRPPQNSWTVIKTDNEFKVMVQPFAVVFFDAEGNAIDGFEDFEAAIDASRNGVDKYAGATLKLMKNITFSTSGTTAAGNAKYDLTDANFAVLDLNGKDLTVDSNFWNGGAIDGIYYDAIYSKKFVIPENSTLTANNQFKVFGTKNEIEIAGKVDINGEWHVFQGVKITFKGDKPQINVNKDNADASYFTPDGDVTFDFKGVNEAYKCAPIYVKAGCASLNGKVFFKNMDAVANTQVPLIEGPSAKTVGISNNDYGDAIINSESDNRKTVYVDSSKFPFETGNSTEGFYCHIGPNENSSLFEHMVGVATKQGEMIKLLQDVVVSDYLNLVDKDFAGIDLNGFNLTFNVQLLNGYYESGNPNAYPTQYGKKFIIPSDSTLTLNSQCKMASINSDRWNEFIIEGTLDAYGPWHNFWDYIKFVIKGPNAQVNYTGSTHEYDNFSIPSSGKLVFDFTGMTEPWERAPFFGDGRDMACNGTIEYINDNFTKPGKVPLMQVTKGQKIQMTGLPVTDEGEYNMIYKEVKGTVAVDDVKVKISSAELASKFGGTMPTTADFKATQANGLPFLDCYVLGLDKNNAASKPFINKRESAAGKLKLGLDNVDVTVNAASGVVPKFTLKASEDNVDFAAVGSKQTLPEFEIGLPSDKVKYYKIEYSFE